MLFSVVGLVSNITTNEFKPRENISQLSKAYFMIMFTSEM